MSTSADPGTRAGDSVPPDTPVAVEEDTRVQSNSAADRFMRRLLRLPEGKTSTATEARSAFQKSLIITSCRCLLMYIALPFVLPIVGIASDVGPMIGLVIGILAIVSIIYSIRRFWRADHSKRWHYTIFGGVIIGFLVYLSIKDLAEIFG